MIDEAILPIAYVIGLFIFTYLIGCLYLAIYSSPHPIEKEKPFPVVDEESEIRTAFVQIAIAEITRSIRAGNTFDTALMAVDKFYGLSPTEQKLILSCKAHIERSAV